MLLISQIAREVLICLIRATGNYAEFVWLFTVSSLCQQHASPFSVLCLGSSHLFFVIYSQTKKKDIRQKPINLNTVWILVNNNVSELVNCNKKHVILIWSVNRISWVWGIWVLFVLFLQFFCFLKLLKTKVYFLKSY